MNQLHGGRGKTANAAKAINRRKCRQSRQCRRRWLKGYMGYAASQLKSLVLFRWQIWQPTGLPTVAKAAMANEDLCQDCHSKCPNAQHAEQAARAAPVQVHFCAGYAYR